MGEEEERAKDTAREAWVRALTNPSLFPSLFAVSEEDEDVFSEALFEVGGYLGIQKEMVLGK